MAERQRNEYYSTREAAAALGCSVVTMKNHVASGLVVPDVTSGGRNFYLKSKIDALRQDAYPEGLSFIAIAKRYGLSRNTVKRGLRRLQVQPLGQNRAVQSSVFDLDTVEKAAQLLGWLRSPTDEA